MLQWTLGCIWPLSSLCLYVWGKYPVVQWLGHRVAQFLTSKGPPHCFPEWLYQLAFPQQCRRDPLSPHPHQQLLFLALSIFAILTGVRRYLSVVLIWIFHCIYGPHLLNPVICWRASQLLPQFSYCGQCCNEHWGAYGPSLHHVCVFGIIPSSASAGS